MSTEKHILDHSALKRRPAFDLSQNADALSPQECAASRIDAVIAVTHRDLRARSAQTNELIKRSLATVSNTMEMIAFSQEAIARSRVLLDGARGPIVRNRQQIVANIDELEIEAINTENPFGNVGYILVVRKPPSIIQLLLLNQRRIEKLATMFEYQTTLCLTARPTSVVSFLMKPARVDLPSCSAEIPLSLFSSIRPAAKPHCANQFSDARMFPIYNNI